MSHTDFEAQISRRIREEIGRFRRLPPNSENYTAALQSFDSFLQAAAARVRRYYTHTHGHYTAESRVEPLYQVRRMIGLAVARRLEPRAFVQGLLALSRQWEERMHGALPPKRHTQIQRGLTAVLRGVGRVLTPAQKHTLNTKVAVLIGLLRKLTSALAITPSDPAQRLRHVQSIQQMIAEVNQQMHGLVSLLNTLQSDDSYVSVSYAIESITGFNKAIFRWRVPATSIQANYEEYAKELRSAIAKLHKALHNLVRGFRRAAR